MKYKESYIKKLIKLGEHQQQDFKFEISDSKKIARSLVAFANTYGGRLLVGVKDNGNIAGVRSEEEYYMIEAAAQIYCRPEMPFQTKEWNVEGKKVLEIIIEQGIDKPYLALEENGKWMAYVRVKDQNILANTVLLKVWKKLKQKKSVKIKYKSAEKFLLHYLKDNSFISFHDFRKNTGISISLAEHILSDFIVLDIVKINISETQTTYSLVDVAEVQKKSKI